MIYVVYYVTYDPNGWWAVCDGGPGEAAGWVVGRQWIFRANTVLV